MQSINFKNKEQIKRLKIISSSGTTSTIRQLTNDYVLKVYKSNRAINSPSEADIIDLSKIKTDYNTFIVPVSICNIDGEFSGYVQKYVKGVKGTDVSGHVTFDDIVFSFAKVYNDVSQLSYQYNYLMNDIWYQNVLYNKDNYSISIIDLDFYKHYYESSDETFRRNFISINQTLITSILMRIYCLYEHLCTACYNEYSKAWVIEIGTLINYGISGRIDAISFIDLFKTKMEYFLQSEVNTIDDATKGIKTLIFRK